MTCLTVAHKWLEIGTCTKTGTIQRRLAWSPAKIHNFAIFYNGAVRALAFQQCKSII